MYILSKIYYILLFTTLIVTDCKDLYSLLGLSSSATMKEIKKAYRQRARDTHPDKNPDLDPEEASRQFREIAEAYEVLSDAGARREYDRTGKTPQQREEEKRNNARSYNHPNRQQHRGNSYQQWDFGWSSFFKTSPNIKYHSFYRNYLTRKQILLSQSRVLKVTGLQHLETIVYEDEDGLTERYVLLAVYDSRIDQCENLLDYYVMYPWPFAGFTREADTTMWWEETVIAAKINLAYNTQDAKDLATHLGINFDGKNKIRCPAVAFFPRKSKLTTFDIWSASKEDDPEQLEFRTWVWDRLRMTIHVRNKTPWVIHQWWLDGTRGKRLDDLAPGETYACNTYLSHAFFYRAAHVQGNILNNQSGLLWYTSRIQDDNSEVAIYPRCFDLHSDCVRWEREGFCDKNSHSSRRNPGWHEWVSQNCFISCSLPGCDSETV